MMCRCWLLQGVGDEYTIDEPIPEELLTEDLPDAVVAYDESHGNEEKHSEVSAGGEKHSEVSAGGEKHSEVSAGGEKHSEVSTDGEKHSEVSAGGEQHINEETHIDDEQSPFTQPDEDELRQRK